MRLNQILLVPLGILNFALCCLAAIRTVTALGELPWVGALMATGAVVAYTVMILFWTATTRTSAKMFGVQIPSLLGLCLTGIGVYLTATRIGTIDVWALTTALAGYAITLWYTSLYGNFKRDDSPALRMGSRLPTLPFDTLDGTAITSADFIGSQNPSDFLPRQLVYAMHGATQRGEGARQPLG